MGTSILIIAFKDENTPDHIWDLFVEEFLRVYPDGEYDSEFLTSNTIYCSYSCAYINKLEIDLDSFKGSGIEIQLTYLEQEPDETLIL